MERGGGKERDGSGCLEVAVGMLAWGLWRVVERVVGRVGAGGSGWGLWGAGCDGGLVGRWMGRVVGGGGDAAGVRRGVDGERMAGTTRVSWRRPDKNSKCAVIFPHICAFRDKLWRVAIGFFS